MRKICIALALGVMAVLATSPIQAATEISVVALPNPIGIPEIMIVIALLGFALWKTLWIRVLISLCLIVWGAFAMPYDIKIAAPLVTVGVLLFIIGILNLLKQYRGDEKEV